MNIKQTFFVKGNTEFYDFSVDIAYVTEEDKKEEGYYIIFLPIFKYTKSFDKLYQFKRGYKIDIGCKDTQKNLEYIIKNKNSYVKKYLPKIESKLLKNHAHTILQKTDDMNKKYATEDLKDSVVESINYSNNISQNKTENNSIVKLRDLEKEIISCHEAGHAIVACVLNESNFNIRKISIIPNGESLGCTINYPKEECYLYTKTELLNKIKLLLAGKIAEELLFKEHSTGVYNDLKKSSKIALDMVCKYGMSNRAYLFVHPTEDYDISEEDIKKAETILSTASKEVVEILKNYKKELKIISSELYEKEELDFDYIKNIIQNSKSDKKQLATS